MRRIQRENLFYLLTTAAVVVGGYAFLRYAYRVTDRTPFTQEIVIIVLGVIGTVLITATLLNKQTEVELRKEQSIKFIELKTRVYMGLYELIESMLIKGDITPRELMHLQFMTHKLSLVASPNVLFQYAEFLNIFTASAADLNIDPQQANAISRSLARLAVEIRKDLVGEQDELSGYSTEAISAQILENLNDSQQAG